MAKVAPESNSTSSLRVFIYEPYAFKIYGNLKYILGLVRLLMVEGISPILCVPREGDLAEAARALGATVHILPLPSPLDRFGGGIKLLKVWASIGAVFAFVKYQRDVLALLRDLRVDIVQTQNVRGMLSVGVACFLAHIPRILYIKGEIKNPLLDIFATLLSSVVVVQSRKLLNKTSLLARYLLKRKLIVVPNGLDINDSTLVEAAKRISERSSAYSRFICVSQLYPPKGIDLLLESFSEIINSHPNSSLLVIGDAGAPQYEEYATSLRNCSMNPEFKGKVNFYGYHPSPPALFEASDIFVLPSFSEGMPRSILEAMACGMPIVATRVGAVDEVIEHQVSGLLVTPHSKSELKSAMLSLLENYPMARNLGDSAMKRIHLQFTLEKNVGRTIEVYRRAVNG